MQINFNYKKTALVEKSKIELYIKQINKLILNLKKEFNKGYKSDYSFINAPSDEINLNKINNLILKKKKLSPSVLIIIGIGGSNLGALAVFEFLKGKFFNQISNNLKVYFVDTLDSDNITNIYNLAEKELKQQKNILINLISKSGNTLESIANFEIFLHLLKKYKPNDYNNFIVITSEKSTPLIKYANKIKCDILETPKKIGGRFSVFTAVGLFPLGIIGIDIIELLQGAKEIITNQFTAKINYAAISATLLYSSYNNGLTIHDTFLFSVDLESTGKWYRQLMAESLGKNEMGITPTTSIGSNDLHSILQLNLAGPLNKFTTFVTIEKNKSNIKTPKFYEFENIIENIQNLELSKIMQAMVYSTQLSYQEAKRPFCTIKLKNKKPKTIGQFLQFKMFEIIYLAHLFDLNPFDQPAVENYKEETIRILKNLQKQGLFTNS